MPPTRVMVFGTFDVLHNGHLDFFKQARKLAKRPFLIVSVARDANVKKIKGQKPLFPEKFRLRRVRQSKLVDRAVLGGLNNYLPHIIRQKPRIIALGYDQKAYVKGLKYLLSQNGLRIKIFRLKPHKRHVYKSSLLKKRVL